MIGNSVFVKLKKLRSIHFISNIILLNVRSIMQKKENILIQFVEFAQKKAEKLEWQMLLTLNFVNMLIPWELYSPRFIESFICFQLTFPLHNSVTNEVGFPVKAFIFFCRFQAIKRNSFFFYKQTNDCVLSVAFLNIFLGEMASFRMTDTLSFVLQKFWRYYQNIPT